MSVRLKLVVIVLFASLVPLLVLAFTALRIHRQAFDDKTSELHRSIASSGALLSAQRLESLKQTIGTAVRSVPWADASDKERVGALWLLYKQFDEIAVVSLFDEHRKSIARSAFIEAETAEPPYDAHPRASLSLLTRFYAHLPFDEVTGEAVGVGGPFLGKPRAPNRAAEVLLPLVVGVSGPGGRIWGVAVAFGLDPLCAGLARAQAGATELLLIDDQGRILCGAGEANGATSRLQIAPTPLMTAIGGEADGAKLVSYQSVRGQMSAAVAPVGSGWTVVAQQPRRNVTAMSDRMRWQTLFWVVVSAMTALAAGLFLARGISVPVRRLAAGARELARGNFEHRVQADGRDEFARLATTFNQMSSEVEQRNAEIEAFNEELQARVDERTDQLKEAQKQLLQSQKIAAVSSLAAGVAHEINNPLTGVIGLTQLLQQDATSDAGDDPAVQHRAKMLGRIEAEAKRISDIVATMLMVSEEGSPGDGFADLSIVDVVEEALRLGTAQLSERAITLTREFANDIPSIYGSSAQLRQMFVHIIQNAITAMEDGGTLTLRVRSVEGELVTVEVADTGKGIPADQISRVFEPFYTSKQEWKGRGLGLAVAYRIALQHSGTIQIESEQDKGTWVIVKLPAGGGGAHLA